MNYRVIKNQKVTNLIEIEPDLIPEFVVVLKADEIVPAVKGDRIGVYLVEGESFKDDINAETELVETKKFNPETEEWEIVVLED